MHACLFPDNEAAAPHKTAYRFSSSPLLPSSPPMPSIYTGPQHKANDAYGGPSPFLDKMNRTGGATGMRGSHLLMVLLAFACFQCHLAARHDPKHTPAVVHSGGAASSGAPDAVRCQDRTVCSEKGLFFPPIPFVPEPPNIGGVPIPPNPITPAPPSLIPPVFPTPSPPSILPPLTPQPPPSSLIPPILPLPLLNPPSPPPPPPSILPPLPLIPPTPLFPGIPPASSSKNGRPAKP